jgi:pimeloyl-ACP methyl ester carboxylesterase
VGVLAGAPGSWAAGLISLKDGRVLGYAEFGDPAGSPVFYFHGVPGVRVALVGVPTDYENAGIRLITLDRPGCGVSSRKAGWAFLDWPGDILQLAEALGFSRFGIIAESGGGPFGLACAYLLSNSLTSVVISSGAGPMDRHGSRQGIKPLNRFAMTMLPRKRVATLGLHILRALYLRWPDFVVDDLLCRDSPIADVMLLGLQDVRDSTRRMLVYATRNGVGGLADELGMLVSPWGFAPEQIPIAIRFWHGDADNTVPLHHAEYLSSRISGSSLVICPGEGHLVMARHLPEILDAVRQVACARASA